MKKQKREREREREGAAERYARRYAKSRACTAGAHADKNNDFRHMYISARLARIYGPIKSQTSQSMPPCLFSLVFSEFLIEKSQHARSIQARPWAASSAAGITFRRSRKQSAVGRFDELARHDGRVIGASIECENEDFSLLSYAV